MKVKLNKEEHYYFDYPECHIYQHEITHLIDKDTTFGTWYF
jgi:hypothetical protein